MVTVSLLNLVAIDGSKPLWPDTFRALVEEAESAPDERERLGVIADWCDEHDEPDFAAAFRWLHKRPEVGIAMDRWGWSLKSTPRVLGYDTIQGGADSKLVGVVAALADRLAEVRASLS